MKRTRPVWKSTCERFVAFFDIMGFKDFVYRNSHENVLRRMNYISSKINEIKNEIIDSSGSVSISDSKIHEYDDSLSEIFPIMFSDSILFVSNDNSFNSALKIVSHSASFIAKLLAFGIPVKGALAYGEFSAIKSKSIYFGQPVIDAFELQEDLQMYGVVLHHTIEDELASKKWLYIIEAEDLLFRYKTPMKSGKISHYSLNWIEPFNQEPNNLDNTMEYMYYQASGYPRKYIDNTVEFIDKVEENYKS